MQPSQATSTNRDSVPFPHLLKASEGLDILELSGEKVLLGEDRPEETDAALGYAQDDLVVRDVLRRPLLLGDLEVDRDPCAGRTSSTSGNIIFPTRQTEAQLARGSSPDIKPAVPQAEITPNQAGFGRLATTPALEAPTPYGAQRGPLAMNTAGGGGGGTVLAHEVGAEGGPRQAHPAAPSPVPRPPGPGRPPPLSPRAPHPRVSTHAHAAAPNPGPGPARGRVAAPRRDGTTRPGGHGSLPRARHPGRPGVRAAPGRGNWPAGGGGSEAGAGGDQGGGVARGAGPGAPLAWAGGGPSS